jgi:isopentenyl-diphosphate delta-isomerase
VESRKKDHIELAFNSQVAATENDSRFWYEPLLNAHPSMEPKPLKFLGRELQIPFWVSSMTGGTQLAGKINTNLARACRDFGMGMGLGSCRIILEDDTHFKDFNMRPVIGPDLPLWANLGIAQLENLLEQKKTDLIVHLVQRLQADGIIIHVNPMQEWLQPEGDRLRHPPIESVRSLLEKTNLQVIVKEVGQGMGPESIKLLLQLPLAAIEFAAFGGTNFSRLELLRNSQMEKEVLGSLVTTGHTAEEMLGFVNLLVNNTPEIKCKQLIISGGIKTYLDGYYLISKSKLPAIFGQASGMLKYAREDYEELHAYVDALCRGYRMAESFLLVRQ